MNWSDIKKDIQDSLLSRGLKKPRIRLNALDNLESILKEHFSDFLKDPQANFGKTDKTVMKNQLAKFKENGRLNSAESSIINEIYYRISNNMQAVT